MITKKSFFHIYTYSIIVILLLLVSIVCYDFTIEIFSDRDLIRSQNLKNSFEIYGADFGMQNGRRVPGGFNYYYLYLLTNISNNVLILNYITLSITIFSFLFLLVSTVKWMGINGSLFSAIFFLTSSTFITQIIKFWNPTLGLPFIILALAFYLNFLDKKKASSLFLAFTFVFLANQFHVSYSVLGFTFIILSIYLRLLNFFNLSIIFIFSLIVAYLPLIFNSFIPLIDENLNDYFLINSIKITDAENINVFIWFLDKFLSKFSFLINYLYQKKLFLIGIILLFATSVKFFFILKNNLFFKNHKKNFILYFLIVALILQILFHGQITNRQFIYFFSIIILGIFSSFLLLKEETSINLKTKNTRRYLNILFSIFFLIVIISSMTFSLTYGLFQFTVGSASRYDLVILPVYSLIAGYSLAIIYQWSKTKSEILKNLSTYFILILITLKTILFFNSQFYSINKNFKNDYNFKVSIINMLAKNFNLSKKDFLTKVGIGFFDKEIKPNNKLGKSSFEFYINNNFEDNKLSVYNNCLLVLIDNHKNSYHEINIEYFLRNLSNNQILFGSKVNINQTLKFKDFLVVEYKPNYGDCIKNTSNDYIINEKEKETLKFLLDKENNKFFSYKTKNLNKYYLNIMSAGMKYPVDILLEFRKKDNLLKINTHSKRLRNSHTILNGYWDSTNLLNPKIVFKENKSNNVVEVPLLQGVLGQGFLRTPWFISTSLVSKGNYTVWLQADELYEKFNKKKIENLNFLIDDNFNYK